MLTLLQPRTSYTTTSGNSEIDAGLGKSELKRGIDPLMARRKEFEHGGDVLSEELERDLIL